MSADEREDGTDRLKQEISALMFIFSEEGEMVVSEELERWLEGEEEGPDNGLRFKVQLGDRKFYSMPLYLEVTLDPRNNYRCGPRRMTVVSSGASDWGSERPFFLSESQFKYIVLAGKKAFVPDRECIYDQVVACREAAEEVIGDVPREKTPRGNGGGQESDSDFGQLPRSPESGSDEGSGFEQGEVARHVWSVSKASGAIKWGQRACYSHHIRNKTKRRLIVEWARELSLGGYCKIGYPGIIIVEGPEDCCLEYIRRLQRLRWKQFTVRGEIIKDVPLDRSSPLDDLEETINSFRVLPSAMIELPADGTKVLARICEDLGIKDLFLTIMKIYS